MKKDFFVILLGGDDNAYGNARLLHEEYKIKPLLLCSRAFHSIKYSKILNVRTFENFSENDVFVKNLLEILKNLNKEYKKIIVIPCSDYYTNLLIRNYEKFEGLITNKFVDLNLLEAFYKKDKFYSLCEKYGLTYPKTYIANCEDRLLAIDKIPFDFPIVVKPDNSNSSEYLDSSFDGKKKVYYFFDKKSYIKTITEMNKSTYKGKLIIQEFIPGGDDYGAVVNSYSNSDGKVLLSVMGQPILEEYEPSLLGNYAAIITRNNEKIYKMIKNFLESIHYVGFSNIDLKYDKKNDRYLAFELNPRLGRSSFYVRAANKNFMKTIIDDVIYDKNSEYECGTETALWLNINKKTLYKYCANENLVNEAKQLIKNKKYLRTLNYKKDAAIKRKLIAIKHYKVQDSFFPKYYFKKNELGLKD